LLIAGWIVTNVEPFWQHSMMIRKSGKKYPLYGQSFITLLYSRKILIAGVAYPGKCFFRIAGYVKFGSAGSKKMCGIAATARIMAARSWKRSSRPLLKPGETWKIFDHFYHKKMDFFLI
jgi:hypothetical protein